VPQCSFFGLTGERTVDGPDVSICARCVVLCIEILAAQTEER
jgi:hypothetical protein